MPGSLFELRCPDCGALHKIQTGASMCFEHHEPWDFGSLRASTAASSQADPPRTAVTPTPIAASCVDDP